MKETVTIYYKSQVGGTKKLDRYLKKKLKKKTLSFSQIDKLGILCEAFSFKADNKIKMNQTFVFSVVFTNHFLKNMEVIVKYNPLERLSNSIFLEIEGKLKLQLFNKPEKEKKMLEVVLEKDLDQVFESFLNSGFLLDSNNWLEAVEIARSGTKHFKLAKSYCSSKTIKKVNSLLRLNHKEEVLELVW